MIIGLTILHTRSGWDDGGGREGVTDRVVVRRQTAMGRKKGSRDRIQQQNLMCSYSLIGEKENILADSR